MQPLEKSLRTQLERTVKAAREVAETAAKVALEQLGVGEASPFSYLSEDQKELWRKLQIHGRQLGDLRDSQTETQEIERLVEETAYEHWHRMLFARFLAENNLLMYPDPDEPVAVTLEECEDLAEEEGVANGWELAARFAARMLPQIFRPDSPVFQLILPPEYQQKLERLVADLPVAVFTASDSLGWVYQFWQANNKERINKSEVKIGARELPAVTQLFTEPYMVAFLLDNALGAWWAARRLSPEDWQMATSEAELREKAAIPGVPLTYLRFVRLADQTWAPAAGCFEAWPESLADLKTIDPCCGSGHFLVAALLMLVPMRMELEGLSAWEAVDAVLRENLHGLELDRRCVELAAFALALTAWTYPEAGGYRGLPELNLACSGLSVSVAKEEWKQLGLGKRNLTLAMEWLHNIFQDAPVLGSLLNPAKTSAARLVEWQELSVALEQALQQEPTTEQQEAAVVAQGLAKAATLLAGQYDWVITNVPYLARGKQNEILQQFCAEQHKEAKNDLATVFLERCLELCRVGGVSSLVLPQNWLFLTTYRSFREKLLQQDTWNLIARLGEGSFDSSAAAGAFVAMLTLTRGTVTLTEGTLFAKAEGNNLLRGLDVSKSRTAEEKADSLIENKLKSVNQAKQLKNPDARVTIDLLQLEELLSEYANSFLGLGTGGFEQFGRCYWEFNKKPRDWAWLQTSAQNSRHYDGLSLLVSWDYQVNRVRGMDKLYREQIHNQDQSGQQAWGKNGVGIALMRGLRSSIFIGTQYDKSMAAIVPKNSSINKAIYSFCSSSEFHDRVREVDQKVIVANGTLVKVPFDLDHWQKIADEKYPNGLPQPYSNDPTQWIFHGHPCGSVIWEEDQKWTANGPLRTDDTVLQIAVARLLGYRWPAELDPQMELAQEQRDWVNQCDTLHPYADRDGIVCIPPVRGEAPATDRLLNLLAAAYGDQWTTHTLGELLKNADHNGKTLETWLRDKFFSQHCKHFQHRPFIWHIWDGLRDGFAALVNYHKLDRKLLETLIYTYIGDWINRQKQDQTQGIDGAVEKIAAAETLKKRLELILEGENPYDIFVRWKPLDQQAIGWNPDLNDGVRLNIRPFLSVPDVGKKGAGVLRDKPNIHWKKDRGKDVPSAPWYHLGLDYDGNEGDRINDHHLSLEDKQKARTIP
ncbi:MAG: N-6 DNA methylase [Snowella sp.]|nr:N-6 DNA methylase [Snowella sp.]